MHNLAESSTWNRRWTLMLVFVGVVSWHWSFEGARALKPFWTSVEYASVITVFHCLSWALLYAMMPMVVSGRVPWARRGIPFIIGIIASAVIITTATFLSWVNVAAAPSQRKHYQQTIDQGTTALGDLRDARQREQELKTVLGQTSESILRLAQDEEAHGALTTKDRKGPFSLALYSLSSAYSDAAEILEKDDIAARENFAESERVLSTMRDLLAEATAHEDRIDDVNARFAQAAFRLNKLLADLKKSPLRSVLAVVRKSDSTIAFLPARRDLPQETAAKGALIKLATDSKTRVDQLAEGAERTSLTVPRFEILSREEAAFAYIKSFPEYPIICLSIDLLIPLAGLFAAIFFAPLRTSEQPTAGRSERPTAPVPTEDEPRPSPSNGENRERILEALRRTRKREHSDGLVGAESDATSPALAQKANGSAARSSANGSGP